MADPILASLAWGETMYSCSLGTVTTSCVVIRTASARSRAIVSLDRVSGMETIKTTYPAFLAIAAGLFLIAAAAYYSKDGGVAHIPLAALGCVSVLAYFLSRRAAILFWMGNRESVTTTRGGLRETAQLRVAVQKAQAGLPDTALEQEEQTTTAIAS